MNVSPVNSFAFKGVYVTTSTKNHGDYVNSEVIEPFKREFLPSISSMKQMKDFEQVKKDTDFYVLAAGSGSRFKELSQTQGELVNKVSFALPLKNGKKFHMLDVAMAMGIPFTDDNGLQRKNTETVKGSFAEVIDNARQLRAEGKPQKNVAVCCGDNIFHTDKPFELDYFIKDIIDDPSTTIGLIGWELQPEELVGKFAALKAAPADKEGVFCLEDFLEKPKTAEIARRYATPNGTCIANTGMFVIKADAMEWLLDEIEKREAAVAKDSPEKGFIAKNAK